MSETTCGCCKPTRDNAYVCDKCLGDLSRDLAEMPWLDEQLTISITRQKGVATAGGPRSVETPLPWHDKASEVQRALHATLATWVRFCDEEHVRNSSPMAGLPIDTIVAISRWLMWRTDGLAFHELGFNAAEEITNAAASARRIVFFKPSPRVYLGSCDEPECEGDVYAATEAAVGFCSVCTAAYPVEKRRADMEAELDDRLCTAAEIARLATYLSLDVPRDQVRRRVLYWARHARISAAQHAENGDPMFRYGTVRLLLSREYVRDTA